MDRYNFYNQRKSYGMGGVRKEHILSLIPDSTGTALDIGCGNGELAEALRAKGHRVTGIDVSEKAIEEAKKFLDDSFCFDIEKEKWPEELMNKKFDLIIASEVVEHLFDPTSFLKKIKQLASPSGEVIITTPNILFWKNRLKTLFGKFQYENEGLMDHGHIRFFTIETIKSVFRKSGFNVVRERHFYPNLYKRGLNFLGKIFPGLFAYQMIFLLKPRQAKTVVYTAIFGDKDKPQEPKFIPENCDFICFTDGDLISNSWDIRKVLPTEGRPVLDAKKYKILPHLFLGDYDFSVWIDGNMLVRGDVNKLLEQHLVNSNIAVYDHSRTKNDSRNSVSEEAQALVNMAKNGKYKDDPEIIKRQIERYKKEGFPDKMGLISGMIILRKHNEPDVIKSMEDWWREIKNYSYRDQLSFNYIAWKNKLKFTYIREDSRNNRFFFWTTHKK